MGEFEARGSLKRSTTEAEKNIMLSNRGKVKLRVLTGSTSNSERKHVLS
jgi:hypothetical protein